MYNDLRKLGFIPGKTESMVVPNVPKSISRIL